jgi:hypothetical protein
MFAHFGVKEEGIPLDRCIEVKMRDGRSGMLLDAYGKGAVFATGSGDS